MRLVFAGTPEVGAARAATRSPACRHELVGVVTRPDAPAGRGRRLVASPGRRGAPRSSACRCSSRSTRATRSSRRRCAALAPDCCPVVAYGALLPQRALDIPPHGWVNLHFSLLPAWRGAAPVQHAIWAGDEVTGATTFRIVQALDAGPTFGRDDRADPARPTPPATCWPARRGRRRAAGAHPRRHRGRLAGGRASSRPTGVSLAPKLTVDDAAGRLDRSRPSRVDRLVRACTPGARAPGRRSTASGSSSARCALDRPRRRSAPGVLEVGKNAVHVGTGTARRCGSARCRPPASKQMPAADWARGARLESGARLGERPPRRGSGADRAPPGRPGPAGGVRRAARGPRRGRLRQPGAAAAAALARADRPRRRVRHRARLRHAAPAGHLRRGARRLRRPAAGQGRRRRCSTRCGSAPTSCWRCGCPSHAAVGTTRRPGPGRGRRTAPAGFVNAVLRKVAAHDLDRLGAPGRARPGDRPGRLRRRWRTSHPRWVVEALAERARATARRARRRCWPPTTRRPKVTLVARPGLATRRRAGRRRRRRPALVAVRRACSTGGDPGEVPAVAEGRAGVQDEGSQLVALALAAAPLDGRDERWLDLCAGPGRQVRAARRARRRARRPAAGRRAAAAPRRAGRAAPPRRAGAGLLGVVAADGTRPAVAGRGRSTGCSSTRRAPGWARCAAGPSRAGGARPTTSTELVPLQRALLGRGARRGPARRRGGLRDLLPGARGDGRRGRRGARPRRDDVRLEDAAAAAARRPRRAGPLPGTVQLWPHRHGTDAMFLALLRRRP